MQPLKKICYFINYLKLKKASPHVKIDIRSTIRDGVYMEGYNSIEKNCIIEDVSMGLGSYIGFGSHIIQTEIGRFCSMGRNIRIIQGQHPTEKFVSTHPAFYSPKGICGFSFVDKQLFLENRYIDKNRRIAVKIGNDVWIGDNVSIMEGVQIGDGAVIATGAVCVKDVPPYAIVGGVPAKIIRYRFSKLEIEYLLKFKWWDKDLSWIRENSNMFTSVDLFEAYNERKEEAYELQT